MLKVLGLCSLILGVVLIDNANAEVGAKWTVVNTKNELIEVKNGGLLPSLQAIEIENKDLVMLTSILGVKTEILCTGAQLIGAKLEGEGSVTSGMKLKLTGCLVKFPPWKECQPRVGTEGGVILSNKLKGLLVLHFGSGLLRLEPTEGTLFASMPMNTGCIFEEITLSGKLFLGDSKLEVEQVNHLFAEAPLTDLWVFGKTEEHKVVIDGSVILGLGGEHQLLQWRGVPG